MKPLNQLSNNFLAFTRELNRFAAKELPVIIGVEAVKLVTRNFQAGGFIDESTFDAWPVRQQPGITRALMTGSGRAGLRNATRARIRGNQVEVGIDIGQFPYAKILQEGGTIPVTPKMRSFFWAMYFKFDAAIDKAKGSKSDYRLGQQAGFWFAMTRKKSITFPKRKYIGMQKDLYKIINTIVENKIKEIHSKYE